MSLKSFITANIAKRMLSEETLKKHRDKAEAARRKANAPHEVFYFHQADDPYSHLAVQVLAEFAARYDIVLTPMLAGQPEDGAAPERQLLVDWSRRDGVQLAGKAGLEFADQGQPSAGAVAAAEQALHAAILSCDFMEKAAEISTALWTGKEIPGTRSDEGSTAAARTAGSRKREELGHYLGATFYYGGEWYWGLDRLHYLEQRLTELGLRKKGSTALIYVPPECPAGGEITGEQPEIHYYLSFRSPYTYIVLERLKALADAWGAEIRYRFVLPMVMRALPVPPAKKRYIPLDTAREARRLGVPFGKIADPVGKPVERNYSLLPWAIEEGRAYEFCLSYMRAVWSEGTDAGSEKNIRMIVERAGLDWAHAKTILDNEDWKPVAEANRQEMFEQGLWGVPSFRVGTVSTWGQDRLWVIEDALKSGGWKN